MIDPLVAAIGIGFAGSLVAGPAVAFGLERVPQGWRRTTEWLLIGGAASTAVIADLWWDGPVEGAFVYVLAALPGVLAFLAFRTLLATAFVSLAPLYFAIAGLTRGRPTYSPEIALDAAFPLEPAWMLVYGSLYFVVLLPVLVVRQPELFRRALRAYLTVMLVAYAGFLLYPTAAPRPGDDVAGGGFAAWALRLAYSLDPPYNCFPSLHVAYSFVSALACYRVHRGVGVVATLWAAALGVSTLYTKQHYALDVIAGVLLAFPAYVWFLRTYPRAGIPERDRLGAPFRALVGVGFYMLTIAGLWVAYLLGWSGP